MKNTLMRLWTEEQAQDLIEYVLLLALIALLAAAGFPAFAGAIVNQFTKTTNCLNNPSAANC